MCYFYTMRPGMPVSLASRCAALLLCLFACKGTPDPETALRQEGPLNEPLPPAQTNLILDYRGKASGEALPRWVEAYLAGGDAGVEALPEYGYAYAFIGENSGPSPEPLEVWRRNFDVKRAFSRLAAARIRFRLIQGLEAGADEVYGGYYEEAVKAAYRADYTGSWKETDFWILEEPGDNPERAGGNGRYRYLVFVLVPKDVFESEVREILGRIESYGTRDQNSAFERIRENFFEGF